MAKPRGARRLPSAPARRHTQRVPGTRPVGAGRGDGVARVGSARPPPRGHGSRREAFGRVLMAVKMSKMSKMSKIPGAPGPAAARAVSRVDTGAAGGAIFVPPLVRSSRERRNASPRAPLSSQWERDWGEGARPRRSADRILRSRIHRGPAASRSERAKACRRAGCSSAGHASMTSMIALATIAASA
jgi:hypothetical protein